MNQCVQDVFAGRMNTPYYLDSPFVEERARYLAHLLERALKGAAQDDVDMERCAQLHL